MSKKTIRILRPLLFLCGPAYNKDNIHDRRRILFEYIRGTTDNIEINNKKVIFSIIPVIVDEVFGDKALIDSLGLNIKLLEEIVAMISYRTYIFLDSMSTGFEYGLFNNTLAKNKVFVFLENKYDKRKRREIGTYLRQTIECDKNLIIYKSKYHSKNDRAKEWLGFPLDKNGIDIIPDPILERFLDDFNELKNRAIEGVEFSFAKSDSPNYAKHSIGYYIDDTNNKVVFILSTRFAFYLSVMALSNPMVNRMIENNRFEEGYKEFKNFVFDLFIELTADDKEVNTSAILSAAPSVDLKIEKHEKAPNIFKHILFINNRITYLIGKPVKKSITSLRSNREIKPSFKDLHDFNYMHKLFKLDAADLSLIDDYSKNQDDYIDSKIVKISGKKRKIIQYKNTHKGRHLMRLHKRFAETLSKVFVPSQYAFAYKKGCNTKMCVEQHIDSNHFIKLDVSNFFNSIKLNMMSRTFVKRIEKNVSKKYRTLIPKVSDVASVLQCCFYKKHLPLGLITSPILSDIYLNDFDNQIGHNHPKVVYTRYADDILISSKKDTNALTKCEKDIQIKLSTMRLSMNKKKRIKISIKHVGDSIRFLGINIVKRKKGKELTISKTELYEYARKIHKEKGKKHPDDSVINGIILYVRSISEKSYEHLLKSYLAMYKCDLK